MHAFWRNIVRVKFGTADSPTNFRLTNMKSGRLLPGDIFRCCQQAYPANKSSALQETSWPTKETTYHQNKLLIMKENLLKFWTQSYINFVCLISWLFYRARHLCLKKMVGMDGYPTWLSGSGRISTIWRNPTPVGLHVTRRIGLAPLVRQPQSDNLPL